MPNAINIMDFTKYTQQIRESVHDLFEEIIDVNESPITSASPQTPSFREPHSRNNSEGISIDDDINCFISPNPKYKCFKCFGMYNMLQIHGSAPLC